MKRIGAYIIFLLFFSASVFGQSGKKYVREGNKNFEEKEFEESEVSYRKAINKEADLFDANFNLGDALYKQEKFEEAVAEFDGIANQVKSNKELSKTYHNLGNSFLKSQKIEQSIEAYKKSLRYYPDDQETKYNLSYAQDLLKEQQQQKKNQKQNQDKQEQDKEKQDQQEKDQQEQSKNDQQKNKQKQQQQQPQKISKEDANRLLNALTNDEKKIQEKVKKAKAKAQRVKTEKDW